jgi:hypothetical protein
VCKQRQLEAQGPYKAGEWVRMTVSLSCLKQGVSTFSRLRPAAASQIQMGEALDTAQPTHLSCDSLRLRWAGHCPPELRRPQEAGTPRCICYIVEPPLTTRCSRRRQPIPSAKYNIKSRGHRSAAAFAVMQDRARTVMGNPLPQHHANPARMLRSFDAHCTNCRIQRHVVAATQLQLIIGIIKANVVP